MKMNLAPYSGPQAFGKAYQVMLEKDSHAPGSVDREIVVGMIRLCRGTVEHLYSDHTPTALGYVKGTRPRLERSLSECVDVPRSVEEHVAAIAGLTRDLGQYAEHDPRKMQFGGTEEEIVTRGSDWCTDVARVACVLYQIAGFPSRIVLLFDIDSAYSGHVIVEVYRDGIWGAVDSSSGVVYRHHDGKPVATWALMNSPRLIEAHQGPTAWYTCVDQFRAAGISNYFCWEQSRYDYAKSGANEYLLSILAMAGKRWPGGLRWLHGEDGE